MSRPDLRRIARARLRSHRLSGAPLADAAAAVGWLGAAQAQEFAAARWSLGQRAADASDAAVQRALADGAVLRTHLLRPTWHFVRRDDLRWLLALTAPRVHALNAYWYRRFGLDDGTAPAARVHALLAEAVAGGRHRTRDELAAVLAGHGIAAAGLRLGYLLMRAELDGVLCSGAPRGGASAPRHTYALLDERVPAAAPVARDAALAELTRRYVAARGPATSRDFAQWASLSAGDAARGLAMLGSDVACFDAGGRTYWRLAAEPEGAAADDAPSAHLLQGYDEYVMGYGESRDVLDAAGRVAPGASSFTHAVVLDGQVVGHWRRAPGARAAAVEVQLLAPLGAAGHEALGAAVDRYGRFVGRDATWRVVSGRRSFAP